MKAAVRRDARLFFSRLAGRTRQVLSHN